MTTIEDIREQVKARYAEAARAVTDSCGSGSCCGGESADFGESRYDAAQRAELPDAAALASLGCGNPTAVADLHEGETVLDLGSGGGIDVILSAKRVGPTGTAYGVDMTDEMLALAQQNARDAGVTNVHFLKGVIEAIPLPADSVDVVISNCVINLSTDKAAVLTEIARVLRPGGRVGVSDVVAEDHLTPEQRAERGSFVGCIAGALSRGEYIAGLEAAGFEDVSVEYTHQVADGMHGAIVKAVKTADAGTEGTTGRAGRGERRLLLMQPALRRALAAELIGTFALVFAGAGAIMVDAKTGQLGHIGVAIAFGLVIMVMIYAVGPRLRRAPQPRRVALVRADASLPVAARVGLLGGAGGGRAARRGPPARVARERRPRRRHAAVGLRPPVVPLGGRPELLPDVRDHGGGDRHAGGRRGGRDRDRRHGRPRCDGRRPDQRRLDEPGALARAGGRLRRPACALDLPHGAVPRRRPRRARVPAGPRRAARAGGGTGVNVLFVCVANSGRSVMAERLFRRVAGDRHQARSAGSEPGTAPHPQVVEALRELGIDASDHVPRKLDQEALDWADVAVSTCSEEVCPITPGVRRISWELPDPKGLPLDEVRPIRDELERRVTQLAERAR